MGRDGAAPVAPDGTRHKGLKNIEEVTVTGTRIRQETGMTTLVVFGFVIIAGLFFWVLDVVLAWATKTLSGQG